jgi:hypothetical protein
MKDTQNARPVRSQVGRRNEFAGINCSPNGNRGAIPNGDSEPQPARGRARLVLIASVTLFLSVFLEGCGGSFFNGPTLGSMYVTPASPMIATSGTTQLAVYGKYSDGSQSVISSNKVSWSSSDPSIATVTSPGGLVTGVSIGTAVITASTTSTIPGSGCQVQIASSGTISKVCIGGSTQTITTSVSVNVDEN